MMENNCHGCKWLDEVGHHGAGYCSMVVRSTTYQKVNNEFKSTAKVRREDSKRCELYSEGDFKHRFDN